MTPEWSRELKEALARRNLTLVDIDGNGIAALADKFLSWPLPESVCSDQCATMVGPNRLGTNLLTADEARQMFNYIFATERRVNK